MTREQIEKQVTKYIIDAQNDLDVENPKVDFKREWYDLSDSDGINEFLKDTTAIANTVGLDGFIIIGFDLKTKQFHSALFSNSNLKDSSFIPDMIIKRCSNLFDLNTYDIDFQGNRLSIIHMPPTLEKPIFITNYQKDKTKAGIPHRVFVRKNSTAREASKYDIEMMFYDRKNLQPEIDLEVNLEYLSFVLYNQERLYCATELYFENNGRKSIPVIDINMCIGNELGVCNFDKFILEKEKPKRVKVSFDFFNPTHKMVDSVKNKEKIDIKIRIKGSNGKIIMSEIEHLPDYNFNG